MSREFELGEEIPEEIKESPLIAYIKLFGNQHKLVTILYKGLIFLFGVLLLIVSFLIFNGLSESDMPQWGVWLLALVDGMMLGGLVKSMKELSHYRHKNIYLLSRVYDHLKDDLSRLNRIKAEHAQIKAKRSFNFDFESVGPSDYEEHQGWDSKGCPKCGSKVDMLDEICPNCFHTFGNPVVN